MKLRLYLDTSVFGGFFDDEFSEHTIPLFERISKGEFILIYSTITQEELRNAPNQVKTLVTNLKTEFTEYVELHSEAVELATSYIQENVVGKTSFTDCLHIALATLSNADYLVSWNFKHIVNIQRIKGYNSVNRMKGYAQLEIRSPLEFENYEGY
jgi:predicted nucleic acid-binding protein